MFPMAVEAMKAGAIDFIEKPFEDTVIIDAIRRAADQLHDKKVATDPVEDVRERLSTLSDRDFRCFRPSLPGCRTSRSRMTSTLAPGPPKFIGRTSWQK